MKKVNESKSGFRKVCFVKGICVEYSYMRFGVIKCYHAAIFPPLFTEKSGFTPYSEDKLKELVFSRYGHKVKSIINITTL